MTSFPGTILHAARTRAGLSQRRLAQRAGTTQSVVARIELGETSPTWQTLTRLLAAAGFELDTRISVRPLAGAAEPVHPLDGISGPAVLAECKLVDLCPRAPTSTVDPGASP